MPNQPHYSSLFRWGKLPYQKRYLYAEIEQDSLLLSILSHQNNKIKKRATEKKQYPNGEITGGIIGNPTVIKRDIAAFLTEHQFKAPHVIICLPLLTLSPSAMHPFIVLNSILCFAKAGVKTMAIRAKPIIGTQKPISKRMLEEPGYLSPFKRHLTDSLTRWALSSVLLWGGALAIMLPFQRKLSFRLSTLQQENAIRRGHTRKMKAVLDNTKHKIAAYKRHQQREIKIRAQKAALQQYGDILSMLAQHIPAHTWFLHLSVVPNPTNTGSSSQKRLTIEGLTTNPAEISSFISTQTKQGCFLSLRVQKLQRAKSEDLGAELRQEKTAKNVFRFTIVGTLSPPFNT